MVLRKRAPSAPSTSRWSYERARYTIERIAMSSPNSPGTTTGRFTTAPVPAIEKLLKKAGWSIDEVDLFEVNEAFAAVAMIAMHDLGITRDKLNIHGGATALGHPIGASGARIIATLVAALERTGGKRGVAALCIGGGEATAIAVERD